MLTRGRRSRNYYAFISSGDYADAWYLLGNGSATGQSYQGFVNGYANSADQTVTENWESGDTVSVNITALDTATGQVQHFSGTYTVDNGMIAGANITGG